MIKQDFLIVAIFCVSVFCTDTLNAEKSDIPYKDAQIIKSLVGKYVINDDPASRKYVIKHFKAVNRYSPAKLKEFLKESFPFPEREHAIYQKQVSFEGKTGKYFLYLPKGYDAKKPTPVIVSLHGGESGTAFMKLWLKYSNHNNRYIFICPYYENGYWWQQKAEKLLLNTIRQISIEYNIDSNRIYLAGFSSGAHGVWYNSIRHPDLFAAAVIMAGECPIPSQIVNLKHVQVFIIHGVRDKVIPIEAARDAKNRLAALKYEFDYLELPEQKHAYPLSKFNAILEWINEKHRNPNPDTVKFIGNVQNSQSIYWLKIENTINSFGLPDIEPYNKDHFKNRKGSELERNITGQDFPTLDGKIEGNNINITCKNIERFRIFLDEKAFDITKPVKVFVNRKLMFSEILEPDIDILFQTMEIMFDRNRLYTISVEIEM